MDCDLKGRKKEFKKFAAVGSDHIYLLVMLDLELRLHLFRSLALNGGDEHPFDQRDEVRGIKRSGNKIVRIAIKNPQKVPEIGSPGEDKHRDVPEIVVRFYLPAYLKGICIRRGCIAYEQVGFPVPECFKKLGAIGKQGNIISFFHELFFQLGGQRGICA